MTPLVSIIMSAYNEQKYIVQSIESILNQSYDNLEFIIFDDGSTDSTAEIISSYEDKRIIFICDGKNKNQAVRANEGLDLAKGKYIARLDADDISMPNRIQQQVEFLESHNDIDIVGAQIEIIDEKRNRIFPYKKLPISYQQIKPYALFFCPFIHSTIMCRKRVFDQFRYDPEFRLAQDYHLFVRILADHKGTNLSDTLVHYRRHEGNTHKKNKEKHLSYISQIFKLQLKKIIVTDLNNDLAMLLLISESNPCVLGRKELVKIDKWLGKLQQWNLKSKWYQTEELELLLGKVWKECYWKIEMKALFFYTKCINKYNAWSYFSASDYKFLLKKFFSPSSNFVV